MKKNRRENSCVFIHVKSSFPIAGGKCLPSVAEKKMVMGGDRAEPRDLSVTGTEE